MTQLLHPMEQRASERGFPLLGRLPLRPYPASERAFASRKGVLRLTLRVVPRRPFPWKSTGPLHLHKVLVALRRGGRHRGAQHRIFAGRDNDGRIYGLGDRVKANNASKRPLTQASLRCPR